MGFVLWIRDEVSDSWTIPGVWWGFWMGPPPPLGDTDKAGSPRR